VQATQPDDRRHLIAVGVEVVERRERSRVEVVRDAVDHLEEVNGGDRVAGDRLGQCGPAGPGVGRVAGQSGAEVISPATKVGRAVADVTRSVGYVVRPPEVSVQGAHRLPPLRGQQAEAIIEVFRLAP